MTMHMQREVEQLKVKVLELGQKVEENFQMAVESLINRDSQLAEKLVDADIEIDRLEVDLEEECLKILALHQPVAIDLRFVIAVLKINNDLERIGDLAVNVAERTLFLSSRPEVQAHMEFGVMAEKTKSMLRRSLEALVNMDTDQARQVCVDDDEVDAINRDIYEVVQGAIRDDMSQMECLIHYLSVARHLERIADHATNIAEDVIYMVDGEIVRHKAEDYR